VDYWNEDRRLRVGDLVISIGRSFMESNGVGQKDIGIIFKLDGDMANVHWQRSGQRIDMRRDWLMPLVRGHGDT